MDQEATTKHNVLERMLFDQSAGPTHLPLSLLKDITGGFFDDQEIGSGGFAVIYKEMDRQVPLMDEMDEKVDRANADLKDTNVRLKQTILQMRPSRNFCIDIVLLCVILGIAAYLYNCLFAAGVLYHS